VFEQFHGYLDGIEAVNFSTSFIQPIVIKIIKGMKEVIQNSNFK
jgi:hypothetical protein